VPAGRIGKITLAIALLSLMSLPAFAQQTPPQPQAPYFTPGNLVVAVAGCGVYGGTPPNSPPSSATCATPPVGGTGGTTGTGSNSYGDDQGAPWNLWQYTPNGASSVTFVNSLQLPQNISGANFPVSNDYGSQSEGTVQLSGNGLYLTIMGFGLNAATFNTNAAAYCPPGYSNPPPYTFSTCDPENGNPAMAQTGSLLGQTYSGNTAVPRVTALIDANGNVNSSTVLYNIFNQNDARSAYTPDGVNIYVSGQGCKTWDPSDNLCDGGSTSPYDDTSGVYLTTLGANNYFGTNNPIAITGPDNGPTGCTNTTTCTSADDTRMVQIYNNTLYVSMDDKPGSSTGGYNRSYIGTLGDPPATSLFTCAGVGAGCPTGDGPFGPALMPGFGNTGGTGKYTLNTAGAGNNSNGNNLNAGLKVNLSPQNFFFASPTVLYVADTGFPKNNSNGPDPVCTADGGKSSATVGDGGLQKWILNPTVTVTLTNGSPTASASSGAFTQGEVGLPISGTGIPAGTTITAVSSAGANATLSANATVTHSESVTVSGWSLAYTLYNGLNLVLNSDCDPNSPTAPGSLNAASGLYGVTGVVNGGVATLYVTTYASNDLVETYLYGINDTLATATMVSPGTPFTLLDTAPAGSIFRGVSLVPTVQNGDVEVTTVPSGLTVTSANTGCAPSTFSTPLTLAWTPGSTCTLSVTTPQAGATGVQYAFANWQDGTTGTSDTLIAPSSTATNTYTYTATFTTQYELTTSAGTGGTVSAGGYYASGTNATITATASASYYFVNFTVVDSNGTTTPTSNPLTLAMNGPESVTANFSAQTSQTITFGPLSNEVYGTAPFMVSATASSGLTVSFSSLTTLVCTVSGPTGSTVTLVNLGTCTIQATQAGNTDYAAAPSVNQSFQVIQAGQTITFGALSNEPLGAAPFAVNASASSNLPVSFASLTTSVCTVSGAIVTLATTGVCTIQATQAGNADYAAAAPVNQSFEVTFQGLATNSLLAGSAGGSSSVVLAYAGSWTATSNASFLHIPAGSASGTGNNVVVFTIDPFTGTGIQTGTLTIAGFTLTVTQAGTNYIGPGPVFTLESGLNSPTGTAVDGSGNIYFSNSSAGTLQEWNAATQQLSTLVSSGLSNPSAVAVDSSGNVYIADTGHNTIQQWNVAMQQLIPLISSNLNVPLGVAVDADGNVYIADSKNQAIEEWSAATQQLTTVVSGLSQPSGVAVDSTGNLYFSDIVANEVEEWNAGTQMVTPLASGLNNPSAVAVDGSGNVYFSDTGNQAIKKWSAATGQVNALVSSGLVSPYGVAVDGADNVYFADAGAFTLSEMPNAYAGPPSLTESSPAGSDASLPVVPATEPLTGIFAPTSDQSWLTIGTVASGIVNFSFTGNTSATARVAHVSVLGQQITVTQSGLTAQTISFGPLSNQVYGTAPFAVSATASSGLTVSFASLTTAVCTVSGTTVTLVEAGACTIQATQPGNATYAAATAVNQTFQVTKATPTVSFTGAPASAPYGATFTITATTNASTTPVFYFSGVCSLAGTTVTMTVPSGTCVLTASWATDNNYIAATATQLTTATQATPTTNWATPGAITYGTALSGAQLNATATYNGATVAGTFAYTPAKGTVLTAGSQTLSASFTPTKTADYTGATGSVTLQVNQATPKITWAKPAAIAYGTPLSSTQMDATASVPGSFVYSPPSGTILSAGTQSLSVTFTPTDSTDYTTDTDTVTITVDKSAPTVTWATPAPIVYGTALSSTQLDAIASVPGAFVYSPAAGAIPAGGSDTLKVTFTPTDSTDYTTATASVTLQVNPATPAINWSTPAPITYGTALGATQLDATATYNGSTVAGTFVYTPPKGTVLGAGSQTLSVSFTPNNSANFTSASSSVTLQVKQATPQITWAKPAAITYPTPLSSTQLDATSAVPGTFVYSPPSGTVLSAGTQPLSVTFTPTDTVDYTTATDTVTITVKP
jgi:sugar lactone lactonase YvrE